MRVLKCVDDLDSKVITIPGNDGADQFYSIFPKPDPIVEIGETRFVVHVDEERPLQCRRSPEDIPLERQAETIGKAISFPFSTSLYSRQEISCPYHYVNIEDIIKLWKSRRLPWSFQPISTRIRLCATWVTHGGAALCEDLPVTVVDISRKC